MGEWEESHLLRAIVNKDNFQAVVNRRTVTHSVIELYASAKREMVRFVMDNRLLGVKSLVMVTDFWTAKNAGTKFLGLRVYFVTAEWELVSVLLGTRHFQPLYGERDEGMRGPFKRWIVQILSDFGLTTSDFFGSTTDGGADVHHMMKSNLKLSWEWCIPHMTNAATKAAFGMTSNVARSKNPEMLQLLKKVTMTVYQVRSVEIMGDLYEQLVRLLGVGKEKKLIDYKPHRFMSLTRVFERIVKHWDVLSLWYEERAKKAARDRSSSPSPFPLADRKLLMEQLLSLMLPISVLNVKSRAEKANQVDVLISAYKVMVTTLGAEASLRRYDATRENPTSYHHTTLLPLAAKTRSLLNGAFHSRFFFALHRPRSNAYMLVRVGDANVAASPHKKNDGPLMDMVKTCSKQRRLENEVIEWNQSVVKSTVKQKLRAVMRESAPPSTETVDAPPHHAEMYSSTVFSEDFSELFNIPTMTPEPRAPRLLHEEVIDEELERWFRDPSLLQPTSNGLESVLHFWKRQHESGSYRFLPNAARIVFAVPASSAQIERDFGISGQMVTVQRTSLSAENIDMCAFLNRNREFIDVTQCSKLSAAEAREAVPSNVQVNLDPQTAMEMFESDWEHALVNSFSAHVSTEL